MKESPMKEARSSLHSLSLASDVIARMDALANERVQWEKVWSEIAD